jgi:hypothetical protein
VTPQKTLAFVAAATLTFVGGARRRAEAGCGPPPVVHHAKPVVVKDALKIKLAPPVKGEVASVVDETSIEGKVTTGGTTLPLVQSITQAYTQQVIAVDGGAVQTLSLTFSTAHLKADAMGSKQDKDLPTKGHVYTIAAAKGAPTITRDDGKKLGPEETGVLKKFGDQVGVPDRLSTMLASKTFVKGEKVTLGADEIMALSPGANMTPVGLTLTLTDADAKAATFTLDGSFTGKQGPLDMKVQIQGTILVDLVRSRAVEMSIHGTMSGHGMAGTEPADFSGTLSAHKTLTYK